MRHFIMRRGTGKTTKLIAASEFNHAPIICVSDADRRHIIELSRKYDYRIPMPVTAQELVSGRLLGNHTYTSYLVDESQDVLAAMVSALTKGGAHCLIGMTTSDPRDSRA